MFIEIRSAGARVRLENGLLIVEPGPEARENGALPVRVPPADVSRLTLETPNVQLSAAALVALAGHGVPVVLCDIRRCPVADIQPVLGVGGGARAGLLRSQILMRADSRGRLWRRIVQVKIARQAQVLDLCARGNGAARLRRLGREVSHGDTLNREGAAAQIYWPALLGKGFVRSDESQSLNGLLNYGYAVLRSAVLRGLHHSGLHPAWGIHHAGQDNPGNLADDLIEPYRPVVDALVHHLFVGEGVDCLSPAVKHRLAELPGYPVSIAGQDMRLANAVLETCRSHAAILRKEASRHVLPDSLGEPSSCPMPGEPCG